MDATSREQLERLKTAQFERGDTLTALKKERQMYDYEVVSESPVSKTDLARAMTEATKGARRGFPEDELASEEASLNTKSGAPTAVETIGAWLGWRSLLPVIILSTLFGSLVGLAVMWTQGKGLKTAIPFGPFLAAAAALYLAFREPLEMLLYPSFE